MNSKNFRTIKKPKNLAIDRIFLYIPVASKIKLFDDNYLADR